GDEIRGEHRHRDAPQHQPQDLTRAGARDLAHSDLLRMPFRREDRKTEEPEARNEDGDPDEDAEHRAFTIRGAEEVVEYLCEEVPLDRRAGLKPPPGLIDEGQSLRHTVGPDAHGQIPHLDAASGVEEEDHRLQRILYALEVRIAQYAD